VDVAALGFQGQAAQAGDMANFVESFHGRFSHNRAVTGRGAWVTDYLARRCNSDSYQLPWGGGTADKKFSERRRQYGAPPNCFAG